MYRSLKVSLTLAFFLAASSAFAQMGRTWPSEKRIVPDPVTGLPLTFLTSSDTYRQSKIYQTHRQWTADCASRKSRSLWDDGICEPFKTPSVRWREPSRFCLLRSRPF